MSDILQVFEYNQHFIAMMNVINAARLNPPEGGHKHHIIPKCWFKLNNLSIDNSKNNMILLSYEDHVKVHQLMLLCMKEPMMRSKMALAVHRLTKGEISNPIYWSGELNPNFRKPRSAAVKAKISETKRNRMNAETRRRISEGRRSWTSPKPSDETKRRMSEARKAYWARKKGMNNGK